MHIVVEMIIFIMTFMFVLFWSGNILLPIIYSLPRIIFGVVKKTVHPKAIFVCLTAPVFWIVVPAMVALIVILYIPKLYSFLMNESDAFHIAQPIALSLFIFNVLFNKSTHRDMNDDFETFIRDYKMNLK